MTVLLLAKVASVAFLGLWLALAARNNLRDPATNHILLGNMMSMTELKADGRLGQGLLHRALASDATARRLLTLIAWLQVAIAGLLLAGAASLLVRRADPLSTDVATLALIAFGALWGFFLCGGLWFGYWIKTPQVQQVHLALLVITHLCVVLVRTPA